ncbi:ABC transporter permease [Pyrococcus furiosus DSM 3638]|uniref:ABC transporter permease n=3 Tax=Pyrococcus furiosus TaxID=2261 RepID=A0A5C0XS90_PYRFU|nr:ABC transporter permease [Pyrococcus furiosus]AAL82185.1 putative ABC transporter [Pyrococcus furiosus DSM 3638]QEK79652.1 ABC transporter permease [Pyrococcus furiosus DSM 3638]
MMNVDRITRNAKVIKAFIFIQKEVFFSRRFDLFLQFISLSLNILFIGIFANLITINADISQYGTANYLDYLLIGSIIHNLVFLPRGSISSFVLGRVFPVLYNSPASLAAIFIGINAWRILWNLGLTLIIATVYVIFFGLTIHLNLGVVIVILSGILLIFALDMFSAGFRIATKATQDPLNWFFNITAQLVSGLYFPPEALPKWIQPLSKIHPETYILRMGRLTMGGDYSLTEILPSLQSMLIITVVMLVLGYLMFSWGFNKARELGTLGHI